MKRKKTEKSKMLLNLDYPTRTRRTGTKQGHRLTPLREEGGSEPGSRNSGLLVGMNLKRKFNEPGGQSAWILGARSLVFPTSLLDEPGTSGGRKRMASYIGGSLLIWFLEGRKRLSTKRKPFTDMFLASP